MELGEAVAEAVRIRAEFSSYEQRHYGREWTLSDLVSGLATDVGDLARLVQAKQGLRPAQDGLEAALAHEVADCLWAVFVIADRVGVDVPTAFTAGMRDLETLLSRDELGRL
jgi:NTP pyrophosphatase (non-canonical NTP hydrolase)